jgi:hypothetical protein
LLVIKMYVAVTVGNDSEHYTLNQKGWRSRENGGIT